MAQITARLPESAAATPIRLKRQVLGMASPTALSASSGGLTMLNPAVGAGSDDSSEA